MTMKQHICESLRDVAGTYLKDLNWIPDDKFDVSPMGVARSPRAFTLECAYMHRRMASHLAGESLAGRDKAAFEAYCAKLDSPDKVKAEFKDSADAFVAAIEAKPEAELDAEMMAPWGQQLPTWKMLAHCVSHLQYHDGQLNYVQALHGDDKFHWME